MNKPALLNNRYFIFILMPKKDAKKIKKQKPEKKKKEKKQKDPNAPKKPLTAYFIFMKAKREEVIKSHPGKKPVELAPFFSEMWGKLDATEKKKYEDEAKKLREVYEEQMKKYKATKGPEKKEKSSKKKEKKA